MTSVSGNITDGQVKKPVAEKNIRVLIVDDSALMRKLLTDLIQSDPSLEVIGAAKDAYVARDMIKALKPDVLTLDVEMPRMDGLSFLSNLMRLRPMPVVMISSLTEHGADTTMKALALGAVDFVSKPKVDIENGMQQSAAEINGKIKIAAQARIATLSQTARQPKFEAEPHQQVNKPQPLKVKETGKQIIAVGASTGGTEAIKEILKKIRHDLPGIVITQHIPALFSRSFAERMNRYTALQVSEAEDKQLILPGHVYIAPGDYHMQVFKEDDHYRCRLNDKAPVNRHRPSVDVLFESVVKNVGSSAIAVILTGMGRDGAQGLKKMRDVGAYTIAQNKESCVVWGMPKAAINLGAAKDVLSLSAIAAKLNEFALT